MAEQIPITESEYKIIREAVRRRPTSKNLSEEQIQDIILDEVRQTVASRGSVGPGARPLGKQLFQAFVPEGKPGRVLTEAEARTIIADTEASAPPGLTLQELLNLTTRAVERAAYEGTPPGPTMRTLGPIMEKLSPIVEPVLPESPVDLLSDPLKERYRAWQKRRIAEGYATMSPEDAKAQEWLLMRDRPYPPTPGDAFPVVDPYNVVRMFSDPASIIGAGPAIKGLRALFGAGKAAKVTGEMSKMPTPAELREVHGLGPTVRGRPRPRPAIVYRRPERPPPAPRTPDYRPEPSAPPPAVDTFDPTQIDLGRSPAYRVDRPPDVTPPPTRPYTPDIPPRGGVAEDVAEEAEEVALTAPVEGQGRAYRVEGPAKRDLPPDPEAVATQEAIDDFAAAPEGPPAGAGATQGGTTGTTLTPPLTEPPAGAGAGAGALPEGIEEVIKTRTRPGVPGRPNPDRPEIKAIADDLAAGRITPEEAESQAAEVMRRVSGFNERGARLPEISQAEADRLNANMEAIAARRAALNERTSHQYQQTRGETATRRGETNTYTDPDDLTMGMDFGLGRALDQLTPVKVGAIGGGSLGGLYGATQDEENPLRGLVVGGTLGTAGGAIAGQLPKELQLFKADPKGYFDKARRARLLTGWAVPKSMAGSLTAPGWAALEQTFMGHPIEATKNMIRGLRSLPQGLEEAKKVIESGHAPAYASMASTHAPPAQGLASVPGRTMGAADAFARQWLLSQINPVTGTYYTADEAAAFLLSGPGQSWFGEAGLQFLAGATENPKLNALGKFIKHTEVPVGGATTVNSIEQGLQRTPGVNLMFSKLNPMMKDSRMAQTGRQLGAQTALGTGAFMAGEEAENRLDPESRQMRRMIQSAFGKYGLPFAFGMGWQRNKELDAERRRSWAEVLGETTFQEMAGPPFRRNPITEYVESVPGVTMWQRLFRPPEE